MKLLLCSTKLMARAEQPLINGLNADGTAAFPRQGDVKTHANMYWLHAKYKEMHFLDNNPTDVTGSAPPLADESKWQHRTIIKVVYQGVRCRWALC